MQQAQLETYDAVRKYISNQVLSRRKPYLGVEAKQKASEVYKLEPEYWNEEWSSADAQAEGDTEMFFAGKGKGKGGKGKGQFTGQCYCCGQVGHRVNQCPVKDAEMQAKGKGWSKGSGSKGYPKGTGDGRIW